MELTVKQALQHAIKAHQAGKLKHADSLYRAILKSQPNHPDANHNLGVLAISLGKVQEAVIHLKTAFEANPSVDQFWLSYIDALIRVNQVSNARKVYDEAIKKGFNGNGFDKLGERLAITDNSHIQSLSRSYEKAIKLRDRGKYAEAIELLKGHAKFGSANQKIFCLLTHCHILNDQPSEAGVALAKAKEFGPMIAEIGWNEARLLLKNKNIHDALTIAKYTHQSYPDDLEGLVILAACLRVNGELDASLEILNRVLSKNTGAAEAYINRGLIRISSGDKSGALSDLERAHELKPHITEIWDWIIGFYAEGNRYTEAIHALTKMIEMDPNRHNSIGLLIKFIQKVNNADLAVQSFKKVLEVIPGNAAMRVNLGVAQNMLGYKEDAIKSFENAILIDNTFVEAYYNLGRVLKEQGKLNEAIKSYSKALAIKPNHAYALNNLCIILRNVRFGRYDASIENAIISIIDRKTTVRPNDFATTAISMIKLRPKMRNILESNLSSNLSEQINEIISVLSDTPLLLKIMKVCPLPDLELELLLNKVRSYILKNVSTVMGGSQLLKLQSALALQCFTNEYVYSLSKEDINTLEELQVSIKEKLDAGRQPDPKHILSLASFKALNKFTWSNKLQNNPNINEVYIRQIIEPEQEKRLKRQIKTIDTISDEISIKVREQYEENPYPRWINIGLRKEPATISKITNELQLRLFNNTVTSIEFPKILVAGCGSGQHSISTATRFKGAKILAVDLSLSSLAYAVRKSNEIAIENVEYMQADILKLEGLNRKFDIIECSGVLHHMQDPMEGWRTLVNCLHLGGLMKIGLYSELARKSVVKWRNEINKLGLNPNIEDIRTIREKVISSEDALSRHILTWNDFFSTSEIRDLIFHVKEHRFTLIQIKKHLAQLGLEFCGFETIDIVKKFREEYPSREDVYDLVKWDIFEQKNPSSFVGMYQFWCQKISEPQAK